MWKTNMSMLKTFKKNICYCYFYFLSRAHVLLYVIDL